MIVHVARSRDSDEMGLRATGRSLRTYKHARGRASSVSDVGVGLINVQLVWLEGRKSTLLTCGSCRARIENLLVNS